MILSYLEEQKSHIGKLIIMINSSVLIKISEWIVTAPISWNFEGAMKAGQERLKSAQLVHDLQFGKSKNLKRQSIRRNWLVQKLIANFEKSQR